MGLLDKNFTENFELGFNDIFLLRRTIDFPNDIIGGENERFVYNFNYGDVISDSEKLADVKMVSDSKGRLRPDYADLIRIIMDRYVSAQWKEIIWDAKPFVSIATSDDKIYFTILTRQKFAPNSNVVCRISCTTK